MAQEYIIGRTERVRELKALLQEKHALYLSAFFCSGKTLLLDQLAKALDGITGRTFLMRLRRRQTVRSSLTVCICWMIELPSLLLP